MTGKARNWSASGAARFAREARIAAAGHLRLVPVARRWHTNKLLNAYGLYLQHTGSPEAARGLLLGGLGYRPPYPPGWDEITEMVLADEASDLAASLYILTPQMCDVTVAAVQTLTPEDIALLTEDDLPSPAGLVVLPQPLLLSAVTGDLGDNRAYRWRFPARIQPLSAGHHLSRTVPAVRMSLYHDAHGPVRPDTFIAYESAARAAPDPSRCDRSRSATMPPKSRKKTSSGSPAQPASPVRQPGAVCQRRARREPRDRRVRARQPDRRRR